MIDIPLQLANSTGTLLQIERYPIEFWIGLGMFVATLALATIAGLSLAASNRHTRAALAEVKRSNDEQRQFNELIRRDIVSRLRPNIELVNLGTETVGSDGLTSYLPHFRNNGTVEAVNITIYYHVMDQVVSDLDEIMKVEPEIKAHSIDIEGGVYQETRRVDESPIKWKPKDSLHSVILWFTYEYLGDQKDAIIFNLLFKGGGKARRVIPYRSR